MGTSSVQHVQALGAGEGRAPARGTFLEPAMLYCTDRGPSRGACISHLEEIGGAHHTLSLSLLSLLSYPSSLSREHPLSAPWALEEGHTGESLDN